MPIRRPPEQTMAMTMTLTMTLTIGALLALAILLPGRAGAQIQQVADSTFHPVVADPAFRDRHPRLLFDEAHRNFHTLGGRYQAFGDLMRADGFSVTPNAKPFSAESLAGGDVLVIANAAPPDSVPPGTDSLAALSAFTPEEIEAVYRWVKDGGALLLIADHAPFGSAASALSERFGVNMSAGYTGDSLQAAGGGGVTNIAFTRERGTLGDHPIVNGRGEQERIDKVVAFTGQSLLGPPGSTPLLLLSADAFDLPPAALRLRENPEAMMAAAVPARGRSMLVAMRVGEGRVVIQAEAAMMAAQLILAPGKEPYRFGMNQEGLDNQQLALNEMRWLAGALD